MEKPISQDYGFTKYEIPLIKEAYEQMQNIDDVPYSEEVRQGLDRNYKKETIRRKVTLVLTWVVIILIAALVIYKISDGSLYGMFEKIAYMYILLIAGGVFVIFFVFSIIRPIVSTVVGIFIHGDKKVWAQREEERNKYTKEKEAKYGVLAKKYNSLQKYLSDMEEYEKFVRAEKEKEEEERQRRENERKYFELRRKEDYWLSLQGGDGNSFEIAVGELLNSLGYKADMSPIGADGGVDGIAIKNGKRYAIQCKAQEQRVAPSVARDLLGVVYDGNFDGGMLFALNGVSDNTKAFCERQIDRPLEIWVLDDLIDAADMVHYKY